MKRLAELVRARPSWLVDSLLVLLMGVLLAVELEPLRNSGSEVGPYRRPDVFAALQLSSVLAALALRRRFPLAVLGVVLFLSLSYQAFEYLPLAVLDVAALIALFSAAAHAGRPMPRLLAFAIIGAWLMSLSGLAPVSYSVGNIVILYVIYAGAWMLGERERTQRHYAAALEERNALLQRQHDLEVEQVAAAERTRIARELHDVIAHGLGVVVVQAESALFAAPDDRQETRSALQAIRDAGRSALGETRRVLDVMRDADPPAAPPPAPGIDALPQLVAGFAAAGLAVDLAILGERRSLDPGVELSVYRVVEEALTNTLRHAHAQHASVTVTYAPQALDVLVRDDGKGAAEVPARNGHGLVGMRERIAMLRGTIDAGPDAAGGYRVHATVPLTDGA